ncbi:MAG: VOC family protein [Candidatus Lambdaproteobacteria bacterium]|nr:VOC family protein [Candidatus Lambdaproteobacteria bacterium]
MEQRVSLITLGVADVAASRAFYERLGWRASSVGGGEVAFFQLGGMAFGVYGLAALAEDAGLPGLPGAPGGIALAYNVRRKEEVDAVLAEAQAAGARLLKPAEEKFWGGYSGYFADPDGYPWEVAWNPGFTWSADGGVVLPT